MVSIDDELRLGPRHFPPEQILVLQYERCRGRSRAPTSRGPSAFSDWSRLSTKASTKRVNATADTPDLEEDVATKARPTLRAGRTRALSAVSEPRSESVAKLLGRHRRRTLKLWPDRAPEAWAGCAPKCPLAELVRESHLENGDGRCDEAFPRSWGRMLDSSVARNGFT